MERIGLAPGTEVGGYRVVGPLGSGGMGAVYRAVDADGVTVALKLLHPHLTADPDARLRLEREVANLRRARHPGVARVLDAEIDATEAFVVTELVAGTDLATRVRDRGPLAGAGLAGLAEGLRAALAHVHDVGVVHRDLTPGNVMVTSDGPVLIDFGVAQEETDPRVTSTGFVVGTPGYLAPEVLDGAEPSAATDWWGWAAVLAFAATGRQPFGPGPTPALLARVRAGEPDLDGLDEAVAAALRGALDRDPAARLAPEEVVAALRSGTLVLPAGAAAAGAGVPATRVLPAGEGDAAPARTDKDEAPDAAAGEGGAPDPGPGTGGPGEAGDGVGQEWGSDDVGQERGSEREDWAEEDEDWEDDEPGGPGGVGDTWAATASWGDPAADAWVPEEPRPRVGAGLAVGAALVALGASRPATALIVAAVVAVLVRSVGLSVEGYLRRRHVRGEHAGDRVRASVLWPWSLVRAAFGVAASVVVAVSVVVVVGGVGWWLLDTGRLVLAEQVPGEPVGEIAGQAAWVVPALLAVAVAAGLVVLWFGPMARATRVGARRVLDAVAPGPWGSLVVVGLALVVAIVLVVVTSMALGTSGTHWWPLPGPPDLR